MYGLRAPVCGLHNGGIVTHDGTRTLGKVSVKYFVFAEALDVFIYSGRYTGSTAAGSAQIKCICECPIESALIMTGVPKLSHKLHKFMIMMIKFTIFRVCVHVCRESIAISPSSSVQH